MSHALGRDHLRLFRSDNLRVRPEPEGYDKLVGSGHRGLLSQGRMMIEGIESRAVCTSMSSILEL